MRDQRRNISKQKNPSPPETPTREIKLIAADQLCNRSFLKA